MGRRERSERHWRTILFAAGLGSILLAVSPPVDRLSDSLFWMHMVQHVILIEVAAPLIVLSRPWNRLWRPFPLSLRRTVARNIARATWAAPLRAAGRGLAAPTVAFVLMNGALVLWHVPALYDAALAHPLVHELEHLAFFATALLFWAHLLGDGPFRVRLSLPARAAYAIGAMLVGWGLAVVIATAETPLYSHYAELSARPLGLSALADQQLAAGIMWVPASVPWFVVAVVCVYGWLDTGTRGRGLAKRLSGDNLTTREVRP